MSFIVDDLEGSLREVKEAGLERVTSADQSKFGQPALQRAEPTLPVGSFRVGSHLSDQSASEAFPVERALRRDRDRKAKSACLPRLVEDEFTVLAWRILK